MPDPLPRILPWILAAGLGAGALTGCGQKGPLYLPPPPHPQEQGPAHEAPRKPAHPAPQP